MIRIFTHATAKPATPEILAHAIYAAQTSLPQPYVRQLVRLVIIIYHRTRTHSLVHATSLARTISTLSFMRNSASTGASISTTLEPGMAMSSAYEADSKINRRGSISSVASSTSGFPCAHHYSRSDTVLGERRTRKKYL